MKLYYSKGSCSLAVRIVINELSMPCDYEAVNLKDKTTETGADFLTINPKGSVPALLTDEGELLTENSVIQQYLADKATVTPLLPPLGHFKRYRVLEWLNYVSTELHKSCSPIFNADVPQAVKDSVFIPLFKSRLAYVDKHLQDQPFLLGNDFTLPDGYLFVVLGWAKYFKVDITEWANVERFHREVYNRKSVQQALQDEARELTK